MTDTLAGFSAAALAATADLVTPVAVVSIHAMERNLDRMSALASAAGVDLRPHAKTHKSPTVALRQLAHGASGLTVATLREAEVFADAGIGDILVAHPPVGAPKRQRLAALAERVRRLAVSLDDPALAAGLPEAVEVMWEVDTGLHRVGTPPGEPTLRGVRELLRHTSRFRGLLTHGGHAYAGDRERAAREEWQGLVESAELLRREGIEVAELSVGSTPTAAFAGEAGKGGITEMRPGTYVYGDANQVRLGSHRLDDCALGVVATVVSVPAPDRRVLDAGSKSLSADLRAGGLAGYGIVAGYPDLVVERLSEEHAVVTGAAGLGVGDRVLVVPAHACTTVNLHPEILFVGGPAEPWWDPVAARGWRP